MFQSIPCLNWGKIKMYCRQERSKVGGSDPPPLACKTNIIIILSQLCALEQSKNGLSVSSYSNVVSLRKGASVVPGGIREAPIEVACFLDKNRFFSCIWRCTLYVCYTKSFGYLKAPVHEAYAGEVW